MPQTIKCCTSFQAASAGRGPNAALVFDTMGNLYGTTHYGGDPNCLRYGGECGLVFKLKANPDGSWTESVLHTFKGGNGAFPRSRLIFDAAGNLYGTTVEGGGGINCYTVDGCGTVFKLTRQPDGSWKGSLLHRFNMVDGAHPHAGLIFDAAGNLYGTAADGGDLKCYDGDGCGVVFKLRHTPDGRWKESDVRVFSYDALPYGDLTFDAAGNLYGTTYAGGASYGTVFKLTPQPDGSWKKSRVHAFNGTDGSFPIAGLVFDAAGNLYGTTFLGGNPTCIPYGCGVVFKLKHSPDGGWKASVLHAFKNTDGAYPQSDLIVDAAGNLYGTTSGGDPSCVTTYGCGVVFELTPNPDGTWSKRQLHAFHGPDGDQPLGSLIFDASGNLYGTTYSGGKGYGVVFKITP